MSILDGYESFHGKSPKRARKIDFHVPKGLVKLGKAVAIEYECSKLNGGGDGKKAVYRHRFTTPCVVCMDERGRKQLYVIGSKLKVTEAGVEN